MGPHRSSAIPLNIAEASRSGIALPIALTVSLAIILWHRGGGPQITGWRSPYTAVIGIAHAHVDEYEYEYEYEYA